MAVNLLAAFPAHAQPSGQMTGSIKDDSNQPLEGVVVAIKGPAHRTASTNADGQFEMAGLPAGEYELETTLSGFAPVHRVVSLGSGERIALRLTLSVHLLEQTFVTAEKSGASDVQKTPMAISVLPAEDLDRTQTHTIEQIAGLAPSVTFSQNAGFGQLTIRGIGTNVVFAGSDPSSSMYVDGVYLARPAMVLADFLDLERVEVLRGPQGTLYGRNAVGGAINLISRPPSNSLEASGEVAAGTYDDLRAQVRVSGPLVRDRITASGAFLRGVRSGFVQDLNHPDHPLGGENVTAGRGQLRIVVNSRTDLLLSGDMNFSDPTPLSYNKVLAVKPGFTLDNPPGLHDVRTSTPADSRNMQWGSAARLSIALSPSTTLTSLTAYRSLDYELRVDADISELSLVSSHPHETQYQVSQELTVSSRRKHLTWIGGLFLFDEYDRQPTTVGLLSRGQQSFLNPRVAAKSGAAFGQATIDVAPRVSVTAGARFSNERKTIDNSGNVSAVDAPFAIVPGTAYAYSDSTAHSAWTPKFGVDVRVRENTLLYGSATRGFKSGGFNITSTQAGRGFAPEFAWSYEAGTKSTLANGRTTLNVAAFQTDYQDLQVQTAIIPGVIDISNAAAASIRGVEVENTTRLSHGVETGGHLSWLDSRYDRYIAVGVGGVTGDVSGNRLSNAPVWSGRVWLQWNRLLRSQNNLSLRADTMWQTTAFFTPFNDTIQRQNPYGIPSVSGDFRPAHGHWTLGMFVRNLTNQGYITGSFSSPPPAIGGRPGEPRQFGVQLRVQR